MSDQTPLPFTFESYPDKPKRPWDARPSTPQFGTIEYWRGVTAEAIVAQKAIENGWQETCRAISERNAARVLAAVKLLAEQGFPMARSWQEVTGRTRIRREHRSELLKDVLRSFLPKAPDTAFFGWFQDEERWLAGQAQRARDAVAAKEAEGKVDRAIAYLLARSKVIGKDFTAKDAVGAATEIARGEEQTRLIASVGNGFMYFSGDDSCERCPGWNPSNHRCDCGNRRVSWSHEGDFENLSVYAEAY